jgi:hypothetical protein
MSLPVKAVLWVLAVILIVMALGTLVGALAVGNSG